MIAVPFVDFAHHAVPADHFLVDIGDHAGFKGDQRMRDFEGGARKEPSSRPALVGHHHAILQERDEDPLGAGLVEHIGQFGLEIDRALGAGRRERQGADGAGKAKQHVTAGGMVSVHPASKAAACGDIMAAGRKREARLRVEVPAIAASSHQL